MLEILHETRLTFDHLIWWELRNVSSLFWHDNWTNFGPLYRLVEPRAHIDDSLEVSSFFQGGYWDVLKLSQVLPSYYGGRATDWPTGLHGQIKVVLGG